MKNKVEISKINIQIGKKEIELSLEEAHELQQILNETFGKEKTVFYPSYPVIVERPVYPRWNYWTVTCGDSANAGTFTLSNNTAGGNYDAPAPMLVS